MLCTWLVHWGLRCGGSYTCVTVLLRFSANNHWVPTYLTELIEQLDIIHKLFGIELALRVGWIPCPPGSVAVVRT